MIILRTANVKNSKGVNKIPDYSSQQQRYQQNDLKDKQETNKSNNQGNKIEKKKKCFGYFKQQRISFKWTWLRSRNLNRETESLLRALGQLT